MTSGSRGATLDSSLMRTAFPTFPRSLSNERTSIHRMRLFTIGTATLIWRTSKVRGMSLFNRFVHLFEGNGLKVYSRVCQHGKFNSRLSRHLRGKRTSVVQVGLGLPGSVQKLVVCAAAVSTLGLRYVSDDHVPDDGNAMLSEGPPQVSPTPVGISPGSHSPRWKSTRRAGRRKITIAY